MPPRRISRTITFSLPPEMYQQVQRVKEEEGRDYERTGARGPPIVHGRPGTAP